MTDFTYTHTAPVNSSAVDEVWYNVDTKELAVCLHGDVYVYEGVPFDRYQNLVYAMSVGRAFRNIKKDYGPSEYLGDEAYLTIEKKVYDAPDMSGDFADHTKARQVAGTPKNLTYAEDAVVDGKPVGDTGNSSGPHLSMTPAGDNAATYRMTVHFESNGAERTHSLTAADVDEAARRLEEVADALGVEVVVKGVFVHFE